MFTYPNGAYSELSERVLQALGVQVTVTTEGGANRLVKGEPETLRLRTGSQHGAARSRTCSSAASTRPQALR